MTYVEFNPARAYENLANSLCDCAAEAGRDIAAHAVGKKPFADIAETTDSYFVRIELPGMAREEISVSVNAERTLIVKGEKKRGEAEGEKTLRSERFFGPFQRSFALPENADDSKISAKFSHGVLELAVPKLAPEKPKEFEVAIN